VLTKQHHGAPSVLGGVTLLQASKDGVVHALDRRHDEQASRLRHPRPDALVAQDELDLGRAVEGQLGKAAVHVLDHPERVVHGVEEVRVPERDVTSARVHQAGDILHDDLLPHDAHAAVIDRRNGAVPAP
jgi:hypothetical protein